MTQALYKISYIEAMLKHLRDAEFEAADLLEMVENEDAKDEGYLELAGELEDYAYAIHGLAGDIDEFLARVRRARDAQ